MNDLINQTEEEEIGPKNGTSVFDREVGEKILFAFSIGATTSLALKFAGASTKGFKKWKELAKRGIEPYAAFVKELNKVRGIRAVKWLGLIEEAAEEGKWQAAAWKLSHCEPDEYGAPENLAKNKGVGGANIQVNIIASLSNAELREREVALRGLLEKLERVQGNYLGEGKEAEVIEYPLQKNEPQF